MGGANTGADFQAARAVLDTNTADAFADVLGEFPQLVLQIRQFGLQLPAARLQTRGNLPQLVIL